MQLNTKRIALTVGGVLTAALLLSVPVLAAGAVSSWGRGLSGEDRTAINASDDAVINGFRIVDADSPAATGNRSAAFEGQGGEKTLREWRYTRDKSGSPGK
jgi:hypothetical protein